MAIPLGIHIFGASGSGTTTLGSRIAEELCIEHLDTDDFYWIPTDPPFTSKRDPAERIRLIESRLNEVEGWVLTGSLCNWGDQLVKNFGLAIFMYADQGIRLQRLKIREIGRYGDRIEPDGDMNSIHVEFMDWAASYETAKAPTRSRHLHEGWIETLDCPVLRLDSSIPIDSLVSATIDFLPQTNLHKVSYDVGRLRPR